MLQVITKYQLSEFVNNRYRLLKKKEKFCGMISKNNSAW